MSSQLPPNPILTTYQYWNWINVDEATRRQRALDNTYMTFPTVQNYPTFFSKLFFITDVALTKMANTAYVYSLIQALLTSTTWTGSNQFNSIKVNTLANIMLNDADFAGTTTLTNSTFNEPLTPLYSYPITGVHIGRIYNGIVNTLNVGGSGSQVSVMTVTIPVGVYLFSASANVDPTTAKTVFHFFDGTTISGTGEQCSYYPGGLPLHYIQSTAIAPASGPTVRWRMLCRSVAIVLENARFQAIRIG